MGLISWIVVGGLAGWLAGKIMGGTSGAIMNIIIGILGGLVGGFIVGLLGGTGVTGFNIWSILVALLGSVVLIWVVRKIQRA